MFFSPDGINFITTDTMYSKTAKTPLIPPVPEEHLINCIRCESVLQDSSLRPTHKFCIKCGIYDDDAMMKQTFKTSAFKTSIKKEIDNDLWFKIYNK